MKTKIIANYLPQYHQTEENDRWWGKGYTDWVAVRRSGKLFKGHYQPHVPKDGVYYALDDPTVLSWQAQIAKESGIYGFGIYHYWFSKEQNYLSRPSEILLEHKDIDIHFMFIWDNSTWKRTWSNVKQIANDWAPLYDDDASSESVQNGDGILAELRYGSEAEWKEHFDYLVKFFRDSRYIKDNGKPVFGIFNPGNDASAVIRMIDYWNSYAKECGFEGISVITRHDGIDYEGDSTRFLYEPVYSGWPRQTKLEKIDNKFKELFFHKLLKKPVIYDYDRIWKRIISRAQKMNDKDIALGAFVGYDDSPRRGKNSRVVINTSPDKFGDYMEQLIRINESRQAEFVFLTAWNEWGEGAHMEPDVKYGSQYLNALKNAIMRIEHENSAK